MTKRITVLLLLAACQSRLDLGHDDPRDGGDTDASVGGSAGDTNSGGTAGGTGSTSAVGGTGGVGGTTASGGTGGDGAASGTGGEAGSDGGATMPEIRIALGGSSTCASLGDATGCWGLADRGQLRVAPAEAHDSCDGTPCQPLVRHGSIENLSHIELGWRHGCSLHRDGTVQCWGDDSFGQLARDLATPDPHPGALDVGLENVTAIALGRFHSCALADSRVWCWGLGEHGQLGVAPDELDTCTVPAGFATAIPGSPSSVACSASPVEIAELEGAVAIAAGGFGTCALFSDDSARCVGLNDKGQLGLGAAALGATWMPLPIGVADVASIALGEHHGCVVLQDRTVRCFGENQTGEIGVGTLSPEDCAGSPCFHTPVPVSDLGGVRRVTVGSNHSCALLASGATRCWGSDVIEQLGNSTMAVGICSTPNGDVPCARTPVSPYSLENAIEIRAGDTHTCAVRTTGEVSCWGDNALGQLAYQNLQPSRFPSPVYHLFEP